MFSSVEDPPASLSAVNPGALSREPRRVSAYLSARKSHCNPLNVGLEKVRGVSVVRMASPTVREVWNWPWLADEMTRLSNHRPKRVPFKRALPWRRGLVSVQS